MTTSADPTALVVVDITVLLAATDMDVLSEDVATTARLIDLMTERTVPGKQVHDANVVAVALAHRAVAIVTDNARHLARFDHLISIEGLTGPLS